MGNCGSCGQHSRSTSTAKLISANGQLREFSDPIKVSQLLREDRGNHFICSSESMEFDEFLAEISGDEVLEIGELYFELPLRFRNRRLSMEDMADLAVKASVALSSSCCGLRNNNVLVFNEKERPLLGAANGGGGWPETGGGGGGYRREGHKFVAKLSAIVEE